MSEWTVVIGGDQTHLLGMRLAYAVPGEWREFRVGNLSYYQCRQEPELRGDEAWQLGDALTSFVLEDWYRQWLMTIVCRHYPYFDPDEQTAIGAYAAGRLNPSPDYFERRYHVVRERLRDFLGDHDYVVVEGICTFLLRDLARTMEDAVDLAVDDLLLENEQREFIRLLKSFLAMQPVRTDAIHVFYENARFYLEDETKSPVGEELLRELTNGVGSEGPQDDLLISVLLTLAPARLVIHQGPFDLLTMRTIQAVFEERAHRCMGCERCEARRQLPDR